MNKPYRRAVFHFSGFDPRGVAMYRQTIARAVADTNTRDSKSIRISNKSVIKDEKGVIAHHWRLEDTECVTDFYFLAWDDLIRKQWLRKTVPLIFEGFKAYIKLITSSDTRYFTMVRGWSIVTLFLPLMIMLAFTLLGFTLGSLLVGGLSGNALVGALAGFVAIAAILPIAMRRFKGVWLLQFFIFNLQALSNPSLRADIEEKLERFSNLVGREINSQPDWQEVLISGHSNGCILAAILMQRLWSRLESEQKDKLTLLTFAQSIALCGFMREAEAARKSLSALNDRNLYWLDISAPTDGASCCGTSPLAPFTRDEALIYNYKTLNPRFFEFIKSKRYKTLKRNKFELHFQYLKAFDRPSDYEFLSLLLRKNPIKELIS